jgi:lantibiotic leader peptide-processing serine protease
MKRRALVALLAACSLFLAAAAAGSGSVGSPTITHYTVVLKGTATQDGFNLAGTRQAALDLVRSAGGTVTLDLTRQIGVLYADSANSLFDEQLRTSSLVADAGEDFVWKAFPSYREALDSGQLTTVGPQAACPDPGDPTCPPGGPEPHGDVFEELQWDMHMIRTTEAHAIQAGSPLVEVGILDTGIDGAHADFVDPDGAMYPGSAVPFSNVNCTKGRDFIPLGPGIDPVPGTADACVDNNFHGTHVAGTVAARANTTGVVGVAPNVELIPVKVCDAAGYCYSNSTVAGITYAGDAKFEVINMSFFVDDNALLESTMYKCASDPVQRTFRHANERAIQYARNQGVVPVAALGNSNQDLAHPPEPYENECDVVPAETQGVIGTMSLGPSSEKAYFSNYGNFATDVAAPGGNSDNPNTIPGPCGNEILSTIPGNLWGCFQGTSMASPHAAGVSALIVSQFGRIGNDAGETDVRMRPQDVESDLQASAIDLVHPFDRSLQGYDHCFGHGRVDALRAVLRETDDEDYPVITDQDSPSGCPTYNVDEPDNPQDD